MTQPLPDCGDGQALIRKRVCVGFSESVKFWLRYARCLGGGVEKDEPAISLNFTTSRSKARSLSTEASTAHALLAHFSGLAKGLLRLRVTSCKGFRISTSRCPWLS